MRTSVLVLVAAVGCQFHSSSLSVGSGDGGAPIDARIRIDGGPDASPTEIDGGPCPEEIVAGVLVNGAVPVPGAPLEVLVGDSVSIRSTSCVQEEPGLLTWTLSPIDGTWGTRQGIDSAFTVYSIEPDVTYVLALEVRDAGGRTETVMVEVFHTNGFEPAGGLGGGDSAVRGLALGNGLLWVATGQDAFSMPLDMPGVLTDITSTWGGSSVPDGVDAIYFEEGVDRVWLGDDGSNTVIYRGDVATETFTAIPFDAAVGGSAVVHTIQGRAGGGVWIGTERGAATTDTAGNVFGTPFVPTLDPHVHAIAFTTARTWGGGKALYDFADPAAQLYPFGGTGDQKIRNLVVDAFDNLWIASDGSGVARADAATGATLEVFTAMTGLPSAKARTIAVETTGPFAGDVWITTMGGIARWKRDRALVVEVASTDTTGILFSDEPGGRTIWAGTANSGLVYARVP